MHLLKFIDHALQGLGNLDLVHFSFLLRLSQLLLNRLMVVSRSHVHPLQVRLVRYNSEGRLDLVEVLIETLALGSEHLELLVENLHLAGLSKNLLGEGLIAPIVGEALVQIIQC